MLPDQEAALRTPEFQDRYARGDRRRSRGYFRRLERSRAGGAAVRVLAARALGRAVAVGHCAGSAGPVARAAARRRRTGSGGRSRRRTSACTSGRGLEREARRGGGAPSVRTRACSRARAAARPIDLVVSDDVDYSNGFAIVSPPIASSSSPPRRSSTRPAVQRGLDRAALSRTSCRTSSTSTARAACGVVAQAFSADPMLFPNAYTPAWLIEGLAVYEESRHTRGGRINGRRTGCPRARRDRGKDCSGSTSSVAHLALPGRRGRVRLRLPVRRLARANSRRRRVRGFVERGARCRSRRLNRAARAVRPSVHRAPGASGATAPAARARRRSGAARRGDSCHRQRCRREVAYPRWRDSLRLLAAARAGRYRESTKSRSAARRAAPDSWNGVEPRRGGSGALVYSQPRIVYADDTVRGDVWVQRGRHEQGLTRGARLSQADARADGARRGRGAGGAGRDAARARLRRRASRPSARRRHADTLWAEPRWSPSGDEVAAVRWTRGGTRRAWW